MEKKHKIMVVDDHQLFLDGMVRILSDEPDFEVIGFYNNGTDLLHALNGNIPDLIILDIQMSKLNGIEVSEEARNRYPQIKILFISMLDSSIIRVVKKAGINGFIPKTAEATLVKKTIREILAGKEVYIQSETEVSEANTMNDVFLLSKREREIIQLIKKGYRTKRIAEELNISSYTVETHRKNIFRKLRVNSVSGLVSFAYANDL